MALAFETSINIRMCETTFLKSSYRARLVTKHENLRGTLTCVLLY